MKIYTQGSRFFGGQIERIDAGFVALGHELTSHPHEAQLLYANNGPYEPIVRDRLAGNLRADAKVILNVLDIPEHLLPNFDLNALDHDLFHADAVTCISSFVSNQLLRHLARADVPVIHQPIKPVRRDSAIRLNRFPRFLSASRRSDGNKRFGLAVAALQILGYKTDDLALVGNEIGWGDYIGVLSDENLNIAYNSADFVICTGRIEGLCLGVLEGMSSGCVPIVCSDMTTRKELLPPDLFPEYEQIEPHPESIARFIAHYVNEESGLRLANLKGRLHAHYLANWQERTSPMGVARRILNVYESLA